jgi:adenine-specific DNA-methyltransferase
MYDGKKTEKEIIDGTNELSFNSVFGYGSKNKLIQADNLSALKTILNDYRGKVDLIYIDPPFATNGYFKIGNDRASTISASASDELAYSDKLIGADYLEFLRHRLVFLLELLSENGSIY